MPSERRALLVATDLYDSPDLKQLRSPVHDADRLSEVLSDPAIGAFTTERVLNEPSYLLSRAIEAFFRGRNREDLLLLHMSCHGVKDEDGRLFFAARDTDKELLGSTAVAAEFLRDQMTRCRARSIVVMLDCCYSGAFFAGMKGDAGVHLKDHLAGHGRAILTATNRVEYAWEGENLVDLGPERSRFTAAVIDGLETGDADRDKDGKISVHELYDYVYEQLADNRARQSPGFWAELEYRVYVANSKAAVGYGTLKSPDDPISGQPTPLNRRGMDALICLPVDLAQTALGGTRDVTVDTAILCDACGGNLTANGQEPIRCAACNGFGTTGWPTEVEICAECSGVGRMIAAPCRTCVGDGRVRARRTLTLNIPAGVENGMRIRLKGQGEIGPGGGPPGDLYVEIEEILPPGITREGDDLHTMVRVPRTVLKNGGSVRVESLEGAVTLRVPPNTARGQRFRVADRGVSHLRDIGRGDLIVTMTPTYSYRQDLRLFGSEHG